MQIEQEMMKELMLIDINENETKKVIKEEDKLMDVDVMSPSKVLTNLQLLDQILRAEDAVKPEIIQQVVKINNR